MRNKTGVVCLGMFVSALSPSLGAQQGQWTDVSIQGFVYEPQRLPATDARIQSLTLPQGFQVQRFAEGLDNPRMLSPKMSFVAIDVRYSDYGQGISPPLQWSSLPSGTQSLARMMEDPDAIAPLPFVHWTIIDLPPSLRSLPANVRKAFAPLRGQAARQGSNSKSEPGYFGPRPPAGDPPHHYHFQIFALDTRLDLPDGFNRHALLQAMRGHVLAEGELIGLFQAPQ